MFLLIKLKDIRSFAFSQGSKNFHTLLHIPTAYMRLGEQWFTNKSTGSCIFFLKFGDNICDVPEYKVTIQYYKYNDTSLCYTYAITWYRKPGPRKIDMWGGQIFIYS